MQTNIHQNLEKPAIRVRQPYVMQRTSATRWTVTVHTLMPTSNPQALKKTIPNERQPYVMQRTALPHGVAL